MSSYRGTAEGRDRARAIAAVIAVHAALAAVIVTGLNVRQVAHVVDRLKTFDLRKPPPPPPRQPPPKSQPHHAARPEGAPAKKAEPSPVVAPPPRIPAPSPIPAAKVAGTGSATTSGAGVSGSGTGAGGSGTGLGGGGYAGFTPARRITKIPDSEYRRLSSTGIPSGAVGVTIRVNPDGSPSNCRVARSSGDPYVDGLMCQLTLRFVRFDPARDASGRAIAQDVTFFPNWYRR